MFALLLGSRSGAGILAPNFCTEIRFVFLLVTFVAKVLNFGEKVGG
jgi:hypothetical protein